MLYCIWYGESDYGLKVAPIENELVENRMWSLLSIEKAENVDKFFNQIAEIGWRTTVLAEELLW